MIHTYRDQSRAINITFQFDIELNIFFLQDIEIIIDP